MRKLYEGSGTTLDAALADFPGKKRLSRLETPRVEVHILQGDSLITSYEGPNYRRALITVRGLARTNTNGDYTPDNPHYRTEVHVQGYYEYGETQ